MSPFRLRLTAVLGLLGIGLGAAGAHGHVHDVISTSGGLGYWEKAAHYHQVHAVALLLLSLSARSEDGRARFRASFAAFILGILLFSGSLYVMAYTGLKWPGAITPLGGVAFMTGWAALAWTAVPKQSNLG